MDHRLNSPTSNAPEAIVDQPRATHNFTTSNGYEYYDPPPSTCEQRRSPAPRYSQYEHDDTSPGISALSNPPPSSVLGRSPQLSEGGFTKSSIFSPVIKYTELHSTDPEVVYDDQEKEVVYTEQPYSKAFAQQQDPVPGIRYQNSGDRPQVWSALDHDDLEEEEKPRKRPLYKRWKFILGVVTIIVLVAIGTALAAVLVNMRKNRSGSSNRIGKNKSNVDVNKSVGGYINDAYYSKSGAWNGSGIAIAAANTDLNQAIYAFYQDHTGTIQYTLMNAQARWSLVGPVNADSPKALNGTPLSAVQHQIGNERIWHLFYIDEDYIVRERIITNTSTTGPSPIWTDGPLNDLNLKVWNSSSIGMESCYCGNYYGLSGDQVNAGIHLLVHP